MKKGMLIFFACSLQFALAGQFQITPKSRTTCIITRPGVREQRLSPEWIEALQTRMDKKQIDSFASIQRPLSADELAWEKLIVSKTARWNSFRDSLAVPFRNIVLEDTIVVLLGFLGIDDGFTFGSQTICLDITALQRTYGNANSRENDSRIDRIFAHEYTHLLHKQWAKEKNYLPVTFKDSILWECLYEGIGMYRSLNAKWLPVTDSLPALTQSVLEKLYPVFAERIIAIQKNPVLTNEEKIRLNEHLSRGTVDKKWGAFPVAIWLLLEAKGDELNLVGWIEKGPVTVLQLAAKYLPDSLKQQWNSVFSDP